MGNEVDIATDPWIFFKSTGRASRYNRKRKAQAGKESPKKEVQGWLLTIPSDWKLAEKPTKLFRREKASRQREGTMEEFRQTFPEKYE